MLSQLTKRLFSYKASIPATLPQLKFDYKGLEPVLSADLLKVHHGKHHQTYVNNLNVVAQQIADAQKVNDVHKIAQLQSALKFNLGGHINHAIYWDNLAPTTQGGGVLPKADSPLSKAIIEKWGSYENFIAQFSARATAIQGSGWGWLGYDTVSKSLRMFELGNQEMPEWSQVVPLLTIDVWEHAYYIDYQNVRAKYVTDIWTVINWKEVERRYIEAIKA